MYESESLILNDIVNDRQLISTEQFAEVKEEYNRTGKPLSQIIVDFGLLTEEQLLQAVADHLNIEFLDLQAVEPTPSAIASVPASIARMYGVVPVSITGNNIVIAVLDPYNPHLVEELSFVLGKDVQLVVSPSKQIHEIIERHFGEESASLKEVLENMESDLAKEGDLLGALGKDGGVAAIQEAANHAPIVR
jgi:type IV pilus assembly protein PilB